MWALPIDAQANRDQAGLFNNKRAVLLIVFKQPDANVVRTTDLIQNIPATITDVAAAKRASRCDEQSHHHNSFFRPRRARSPS